LVERKGREVQAAQTGALLYGDPYDFNSLNAPTASRIISGRIIEGRIRCRRKTTCHTRA
jgi:hypothetical protein